MAALGLISLSLVVDEGDDDSGIPAAGLVLAGGSGESETIGTVGTVVSPGDPREPRNLCFSPDAPEGTEEEISRQAFGQSPHGGSVPVPMSVEDAREKLVFEVREPEVPDGWLVESRLGGMSFGPGPTITQCSFEFLLTAPSGGRTFDFPEATVTNDLGETVTTGGTHSEPRAVRVQMRALAPGEERPEIEGFDGRTTVNGMEAQLVERPYDEPSVVVLWAEGQTAFSVACSVMSVDECRELAEGLR
ncbi:MAG: hypothetical protein GEU28_01490 [Dehalococcoidia bacterium]|nr:hypothetical protein [Dehalococcoidia bacterium]